jgi:uncharacterized membrane protein required for colicin V production
MSGFWIGPDVLEVLIFCFVHIAIGFYVHDLYAYFIDGIIGSIVHADLEVRNTAQVLRSKFVSI